MHHDECACVHIYAPAAQRCAEVICIMMSVCAYLCIGCSEIRRHDIDDASELSRLTDYLSEVGITMYLMGNRDKIYYDDIMNTKAAMMASVDDITYRPMRDSTSTQRRQQY